MQDKQSVLSAIILSSILTVVVIVLLTVCGELDAGFKGWLTRTFSHHWIAKSVISILIFLVSIPIFYLLRPKKFSIVSLICLLIAVANISFGILLAFFFVET